MSLDVANNAPEAKSETTKNYELLKNWDGAAASSEYKKDVGSQIEKTMADPKYAALLAKIQSMPNPKETAHDRLS